MNEEEAIKIIHNMEIDQNEIECKECIFDNETTCFRNGIDCQMQAIETVLNLLEKKNKQIEQYQNMLATNDMLYVLECEKKDKMINNAIVEIENLRQYFSEDLQPDFIRILEILKDKKVIDC